MHELSVAQDMVALIEAQLLAQGDHRVKVTGVHLRIGPLAGVVPQSLRFAYDASVAGTNLAGSTLKIEEVAPTVYCAACDREQFLASISRLRCPVCDAATPEIVHGRELEVVSVEVVDV